MKQKNEQTKREENCTEQYKGIIVLRKGQLNDKEVWFGTVGRQLVSDGAFDSKEELIENLEKVTLERVTKIAAGVFGRLIELKDEHHEG